MKKMQNRNRIFRPFLMLLLTACFSLAGIGPARALLITTEYVVIGPKDGVGTFVMKNTAPEKRAFRMGFQEVAILPGTRKRQVLDSAAEMQAFPGLRPASPYLYVAPRRLMAQPGQVQSIRFMARRTQDMAPGEYRSYIEIRPEEVPDTYQGDTVPVETNQRNVTMNMKMMTGVRVPVFLVHGDTTLAVHLQNVHMTSKKGQPAIAYTALREGTRSALGTLDVRCQGQDGRLKTVARTSLKLFIEENRLDSTISLRESELAQCVSPLTLNFTPHKGDPAYSPNAPMVSAQVAG